MGRAGHWVRPNKLIQVEWSRRTPPKRCQLSSKKELAMQKMWGIEFRQRNRGCKGCEAGKSLMRGREGKAAAGEARGQGVVENHEIYKSGKGQIP